jgi:hypothetical protein
VLDQLASDISDGGLPYTYNLATGKFSPPAHVHAAADITTGTIATARLASGTASASTYLRGDQTWAAISTYTLPAATTSTLGGVTYGTTAGTACQGNDSRLSEEVLEYTTAASFPATGNASLLYRATDSSRLFAWVGSQYAEIGPASISVSGGGGSYTLPDATTSTLGGVIVGAGLAVTSGTVSANVTSVAGRTGAVTIAAADVSGLPAAGTGSTNYCAGNDSRLTDSREWSAATATQAEAEAGSSTSRLAFTPLRVFQAIAAWWAASAAKTKLDGIATGATANSSDATLLARANHTGTQAAGTITGLATVATSGAYTDLSGRPALGTAASAATGDFAAASHTHGGITNAGAIGSTSGLPVVTGASGVLQAGSFGTAAGSVCQGNDARLSDTRTPTDASVTTAKVADGAVTLAKTTGVQKTITSGTAAPTGGTDGDIYLQYT